MLVLRTIGVALLTNVAASAVSRVRNAEACKRGAAYNDASLVGYVADASWAYNWNVNANGELPPGVEYCPMLWGPKMYTQWHSAVSNALSSGSRCLLGFNEPDNQAQADMNPREAAIDYQSYLTPYSGQATLVTPAVTNGVGDLVGLDWLSTWFHACRGRCKANALAIHYYSSGDPTDFINFVTAAMHLAQQNDIQSVWITEFQHEGTVDEQVHFLQTVMPWLDHNPGVERYAYFYTADGHLLSGDHLSVIGQAYVSRY
ncbi:hypothetical protein ZTR_10503 [Talaromyces verruculosus]|nr:hypothetical protein ZTR_10503 [Talaromyces verruculosus]